LGNTTATAFSTYKGLSDNWPRALEEAKKINYGFNSKIDVSNVEDKTIPTELTAEDEARKKDLTERLASYHGVSVDQLNCHGFDLELGIGVTAYFKLIKSLCCMFLLMTIVSIPTYYFCGTMGSSPFSEKQGLGEFFYALGLGSLGESSENCKTITDYTDAKNINCPVG